MVFDRDIITQSPQNTAAVGQELAHTLIRGPAEGRVVQPRLLCLYGALGSGKTTFVQGFAKGLGVFRRLLSPTFIIVRRYSLPDAPGFLYHFDLYRLQTPEEVEEIGLSEITSDADSFVLIEWAEKLGPMLPKDRLDIYFSLDDGGKHRIHIQQKHE